MNSTTVRAAMNADGIRKPLGDNVLLEPDAVLEAIGVSCQFSAVDNLLTGEQNLILMADVHH